MEFDGLWRSQRGVRFCVLIGFASLIFQSFVAVSLNDEGMALLRFKDRIENDPFGAMLTWKESSLEIDHCSWYGVDCVDGHVVSLKLKDLCIEGVLAPELGHLVHIKLIVLRNNSLSGTIPEELAGLQELEVLDLGFNNFSGPLPHEWGNNVAVLLLDNNGQFCHVTPEVEQLMTLSEFQVEENELSTISEDSSYNAEFKSSCAAEHAKALSLTFMRYDHQTKDPTHRRLLQWVIGDEPPPHSNSTSPPPPHQRTPPPPPHLLPPTFDPNSSMPTIPTDSSPLSGKSKPPIIPISASVGGFILIALVAGLLFIWRRKKIGSVGPWRTGTTREIPRSAVNGDDKVQIHGHEITTMGLSQGVTNVKRSELEDACEGFSNVIGSSSVGTLYKGTSSSVGEIAVLLYAVNHAEDWSHDMQTLFKKKIDKLSILNHKNFLNLLGFCEEEYPFTRMLVFEYAPSGTLFEHLYIRESEHLDWKMRLRIMMGITYCLEHMHSLTPLITHDDLTAYAVNLSEDYAAKLSAFSIWNEVALAAKPLPVLLNTTTSHEAKPEDNVYSLGILLLEMMTGKTPHSMGTVSLDKWALDYFRGERPLRDFVDPMLRHFDAAQLERIGEVIKSCTVFYPNERPRMVDVAARLREITDVAPGRAAPRLTMWWPEVGLQSLRKLRF